MNCQKCGEICAPQWAACPKCGTEIDSKLIPRREYNVIDFSVKNFLSTVSANDFQGILNKEASNGWVFDSYMPLNNHMEKGFLVFYRTLKHDYE